MSESFTVMNGVKQGGVLSPVLFTVYTDGLLLRLQESGIRCVMRSQCVRGFRRHIDLNAFLQSTHSA